MEFDKNNNRIAVALGDFDGMHRAHKTVVTGSNNAIIYCVNNRFSLLQKSIFEERYPTAVFADFNEIKNMSATEFIDKILIEKLRAGIILCGYNFRFGKNAMWSALDLRRHLEQKDIWVRILEHLDHKGEPISSTRIRSCLKQGKIKSANEMLGYNFTFESTVLSGDGRGRTIGFPTANQHLPSGLTVPKFGVYESAVTIENEKYKAFTNIGIRPTWQVSEPLCETHIFGYCGNLYSKPLRVELVRYIREERHFDGKEGLKEQLENDKSSII